ncbi:bifunctional metallophosphatase/5'-nucleotidase [Kordiimonas lacus]|uniref:Calcineurin-like phosphoesterase n=1 Tax=Kordiimonas lacus TaxID=637679 RepID=A0A1G7BZN8_9PROT|nr:5'-nucleotidase C-terminal domain-containing protein [Kordiimonas lacus]SDE32564.1 Calcineurin-like phosphoesterase [Kordiimonas lacus]
MTGTSSRVHPGPSQTTRFWGTLGLAAMVATAGYAVYQAESHEPPESATILFMNDIYRIGGIKRGSEGGLARIASIRTELEAKHGDLLILHAGDALSPSLLGDMYKGAQMVEALNLLDGDDDHDSRLFVTFGNHEFDVSSCDRPDALVAQVQASDFTWLAGNLDFGKCASGDGFAPLANAKNVVPRQIVDMHGIRIGLFGLTISESTYAGLLTDREGTATLTDSYIAAAKRLTAELRADGAEYIIGVTHLAKPQDRAILETLGDAGPDLIIGGHDHAAMKVGPVNGRYIYKQTADARDVGALTITRAKDGTLSASERTVYELKGNSPAKDPTVQAFVDQKMAEHETAFCAKKGLGEGCLSDGMGITQVLWQLEENSNREEETAIGNWLADQMLAPDIPTFDQCDAASPTVALLTAGGLRLNYDLPASFELKRREVEELFPFSLPLVAVCMTGTELKAALENGLGAPGEGRWPHLSGVSVRYSYVPATRTATVLEVTSGGKPVGPADPVRVIANGYTASRGDGYQMWPVCGDGSGVDWSTDGARRQCEQRIMAGLESATAKPVMDGDTVFDLKDWALEAFHAADGKGVGPTEDLTDKTRRVTKE